MTMSSQMVIDDCMQQIVAHHRSVVPLHKSQDVLLASLLHLNVSFRSTHSFSLSSSHSIHSRRWGSRCLYRTWHLLTSSTSFLSNIKVKQDTLYVTQAHLRAATRELTEVVQMWFRCGSEKLVSLTLIAVCLSVCLSPPLLLLASRILTPTLPLYIISSFAPPHNFRITRKNQWMANHLPERRRIWTTFTDTLSTILAPTFPPPHWLAGGGRGRWVKGIKQP